MRVGHLSLMALVASGCWTSSTTKPTTTTPTTTVEKPAAPLTIAAGDIGYGCLGWSAKQNAAVCIVGMHSTGQEPWLALMDTGPRTIDEDMPETIDALRAEVLTETFAAAEYMQFTTESEELTAGTAKTVGSASVLFTSKDTSSTVENTAPTYTTSVTATCGIKTAKLFFNEEEGREYSARIRTIGSYALVELSGHLGREGEYGGDFVAVVLDTATCNADSTAINMPTHESLPPPWQR